MRIAAQLNQSRRFFNCFAKPDVAHRNAQKFTARFVVLTHLKHEAHGIDRACQQSLFPNRLEIRQWIALAPPPWFNEMFHLRY